MICVICGKEFEEHEETKINFEGEGICDDCERIGGADLLSLHILSICHDVMYKRNESRHVY